MLTSSRSSNEANVRKLCHLVGHERFGILEICNWVELVIGRQSHKSAVRYGRRRYDDKWYVDRAVDSAVLGERRTQNVWVVGGDQAPGIIHHRLNLRQRTIV